MDLIASGGQVAEVAEKRSSEDKSVIVSVHLPDEQLPRPEAVNFFAISRVGGDVQIVTAYVDVNHAATVRLKAEKGEEVSHTLKALPMHRIAVSAGTFVQLKRRVDEIYEALLKEKRITGGEHPEHEEEE